MTSESASQPSLPEGVGGMLEDIRAASGLEIRVWHAVGGDLVPVFPLGASGPPAPAGRRFRVTPAGGPPLEVQVEARDSAGEDSAGAIVEVLRAALERACEQAGRIAAREVQLSERRDEIGLLFSISETLASVLDLQDAAERILQEGVGVLGAERGSLWVYSAEDELLRLAASVGGDDARDGDEAREWIPVRDDASVTARTFRLARPVTEEVRAQPGIESDGEGAGEKDVRLAVPIRYAPASGPARTIGVLELMGSRNHSRSAPGDRRVLVAVANQIGAALEMHRLLRENMARGRVAREMELAHDLQMKLLPSIPTIPGIEAAARVFPTEAVAGDFYQIIPLSEGRIGVMIGDVSGHGFPAALIMALVMSAAAIYAEQGAAPAKVLEYVDRAIGDELESTEMYLSLCYCVLSPHEAAIAYSNAGHPHAFVVSPDGRHQRLFATDPPMGTDSPPYGEATVKWSRGEDLLLLFTDGLSDTLARMRRQSGEELVLATVVAHAARPAAEILRHLFEMSAQAIPSMPADDRTAIILRAR